MLRVAGVYTSFITDLSSDFFSDLVRVAAGAVGGGHAEEGTEEGGVAVVDLCARQMTKRVLTWYARKLSKMRNLR